MGLHVFIKKPLYSDLSAGSEIEKVSLTDLVPPVIGDAAEEKLKDVRERRTMEIAWGGQLLSLHPSRALPISFSPSDHSLDNLNFIAVLHM